jgi:catechol 2,3-dioxygenase-like lactoylglutathione lyase family enzyme
MAQVRYIVDDVDQAIEFYTSKLGFRLEQQFGPAMAVLQRDDLQLWLAGPLASASKPMPDGAKPLPGGWNRFVIIVNDFGGFGPPNAEGGRGLPKQHCRRARGQADSLRRSLR